MRSPLKELCVELNAFHVLNFLTVHFVFFFRISAVTEVEGVLEENSMELVENMESPRLIKTHLSFDMLPTSITQNKTKVRR